MFYLIRAVPIMLFMICMSFQTALAAGSCMLMQFQDNSGYYKLKAEETMADLVAERLIESQLLNIKAEKQISPEDSRLIYDSGYVTKNLIANGKAKNNFNDIFGTDSSGSNKVKAISLAQLGDVVSPEALKEIREKYGVKYIIQGNVLHLGPYSGENEEANFGANAVRALTKLFGNIDIGKFDFSKIGIGSECDLKVVDTETGKVIWCRTEYAFDKKGNFKSTYGEFGTKDLDGEMLYQALEKTSQALADALIADISSGALVL